jgi:hypothetical protein
MIVDMRGFDVMERSSSHSWSGQVGGTVKDSVDESFVHAEFRSGSLRSPHGMERVMLDRDAEMVEIGRRLAADRRIALIGPRMEFADARMQAAGLHSMAASRSADKEGLIVIDPSSSVLGFSARRVSAKAAGFEIAAIFVAGLGFPQIEDLFLRLSGNGYRLHPQTWFFASGDMLRWLIVSRISEEAMGGRRQSLPEALDLFQRGSIAAVTAPEGEMLVYLGGGADGEALRTFRPSGDIHVVGESYESTDIAQTFYDGRALHYRPMRPSLFSGYGRSRFAGFYLPCVDLQPGDMSVAIQHAQAVLAPGGAFVAACHAQDAGERTLALSADPSFRNVRSSPEGRPLVISATRT